MVSRFRRWTPIERPIRKEIRTIHLLAYFVPACSYHFVIAQNTSAVNSEDMAYTSPSTAENQNVSEKQYARAPTAPEPYMAIALETGYVPSADGFTTRFARNTIVRYSRKMVRAEQSALITFTAIAAWAPSVKIVKNLANSWKTGFPGGCPTSSLYEEAMNSPQSQNDADGSIVIRYVNAEITNTAAAVILLHRLNFLLSIFSVSPTKEQRYKHIAYICKKLIDPMADNDWKKRLGVVFSTNPDYRYEEETQEQQETLPPEKQKLIVSIDRRNRGGKQVTLVSGFTGTDEDLADLARTLKVKCGVGGSAKDGEITIQGDFRDKVTSLLTEMGYKARRGN